MGVGTHSARRYVLGDTHRRQRRPFLQTFSRIILYKIENIAVAATSFFAGEVEIFDFVTERVKRCIAANRENEENKFRKHTMIGGI